MPHRVRAYIGLGANLGDAPATLTAGIHALAALPGAERQAVSRLYATVPVGVVGQPEFRNAVARVDLPIGRDPARAAIGLLAMLKQLERAFGRRERARWGPRELDLDLVVFGVHRLRVEPSVTAATIDPARTGVGWLEVPHPAARQRLFVLAPLADLAPGLRPPGWGESVASAVARRIAAEGPHAVRPVARWDAGTGAWAALDRGLA